VGTRLLGVIENVGEMALATILAVGHSSHEDASTTSSSWTFSPQTFELTISINLKVLEDRELGFLSLVLYLLGCGVDFLLPLLGAPTETEDKVKGRLFLDIVVRECATVLQLLAGKDETLLVRRDSFFVLDLRLYIINGIRGLHLKGNRLSRESFYEDLHDSLNTRQTYLSS